MGRELRMVTPDWEHPKESSKFIPLLDNYRKEIDDFNAMVEKDGIEVARDWFGSYPLSTRYMLPHCSMIERTHYMMYENTSEGTPISPAFATPEELAHWLADNNASSFGISSTATYEQWLPICQGGYAPTAIAVPGIGLISGVEGMSVLNDEINLGDEI